ncbi:MAG: hypothetical protein ABR591_07855 [Candidatus Velthaea sp.]
MHIKRSPTHNVSDRSIAPVVRVAPGATIVVELENASGGQLARDSNASALLTGMRVPSVPMIGTGRRG